MFDIFDFLLNDDEEIGRRDPVDPIETLRASISRLTRLLYVLAVCILVSALSWGAILVGMFTPTSDAVAWAIAGFGTVCLITAIRVENRYRRATKRLAERVLP
ncbi:MAG: hypothetical protein AAFN03_10970 [Pseudomonadota bacterium]